MKRSSLYHKSIMKNLNTIFSSIIIILYSVSSYLITIYANQLQLQMLELKNEVSGTLKIALNINEYISLLLPLIIVLFILTTTYIMLTQFFDNKIELSKLFSNICISLTPLLLDSYFYWANLINYTKGKSFQSVEDFLDLKYFNGMNMNDMESLNLFCWFVFFVILNILIIKNKTTIFDSIISTLTPTMCYLLIFIYFD